MNVLLHCTNDSEIVVYYLTTTASDPVKYIKQRTVGIDADKKGYWRPW